MAYTFSRTGTCTHTGTYTLACELAVTQSHEETRAEAQARALGSLFKHLVHPYIRVHSRIMTEQTRN